MYIVADNAGHWTFSDLSCSKAEAAVHRLACERAPLFMQKSVGMHLRPPWFGHSQAGVGLQVHSIEKQEVPTRPMQT